MLHYSEIDILNSRVLLTSKYSLLHIRLASSLLHSWRWSCVSAFTCQVQGLLACTTMPSLYCASIWTQGFVCAKQASTSCIPTPWHELLKTAGEPSRQWHFAGLELSCLKDVLILDQCVIAVVCSAVARVTGSESRDGSKSGATHCPPPFFFLKSKDLFCFLVPESKTFLG